MGVGTASPSTYGKFVTYSSGGYAAVDTSGLISSYQLLDVATAGGRLSGGSSQGLLGEFAIEQTTTGAKGGYVRFSTCGSGNNTPVEKMRITSAGNVGIGTSSPATNLVVSGSGSRTLQVTNTSIGEAASDGTILQVSTSGVAYLYNQENASMIFGTNNTEQMRITSGGVLCVGQTTDNPGSSNVITNGPVTICYPGNATLYRQLYYSSNNNFYFYNGSNQAYITSAGAFTNASDARLKEEIVDIKYGIDDVMKMQPRNYQMISDKTKCVGFVAQELQTVIPECVSGDDEHYYGVDYGTLTAVLTKAIQEQQALITDLTTRLAALEGAK